MDNLQLTILLENVDLKLIGVVSLELLQIASHYFHHHVLALQNGRQGNHALYLDHAIRILLVGNFMLMSMQCFDIREALSIIFQEWLSRKEQLRINTVVLNLYSLDILRFNLQSTM